LPLASHWVLPLADGCDICCALTGIIVVNVKASVTASKNLEFNMLASTNVPQSLSSEVIQVNLR
jgi:hypothetical protein